MKCHIAATTTPDLLRALGGTCAVAALLGARPSAVSMWIVQGVPARWHVALLVLCVQRGIFWRPPGWPAELELRWNAASVAPPVAANHDLLEELAA